MRTSLQSEDTTAERLDIDFAPVKPRDWQPWAVSQETPSSTEGTSWFWGNPIAGVQLGDAPIAIAGQRYATFDLPENQDRLGMLSSPQINSRDEPDVTTQLDPWSAVSQSTYRLYFMADAGGNIERHIAAEVDFGERDSSLLGHSALRRLKEEFPPIAERLQYLASLGRDWDGYGASTITEAAVGACAMLMLKVKTDFGSEKEPCILPLADGGLQLDWYYSRVDDLTIVIPPEGGAAEYLAVYEEADRLVEGEVTVETLNSTLLGL
jgi:hypothetical protein